MKECTICRDIKPLFDFYVSNRSNYGRTGWHIDHIVPLASAKTVEELKELCHYRNLQPLWALENISKGDKIHPTQLKIAI